MKLRVCKVDNDIALLLPADVVSRLNWAPGDECEGAIDGETLRVFLAESKHALAMKIARRGMEKYRDVLSKLAKS